jgi:bifunctional DNA-binding transcriptional regulator/antitoxin component of YhaV-PrlF toxin-antitoxin module
VATTPELQEQMPSTTAAAKAPKGRERLVRPPGGTPEHPARPCVFLRDRRQITLPAEAVSAFGQAVDDVLEVRVVEGSILLVPKRAGQEPARSIGRFVGPSRGVFGDTAEQADALVRDLRNEW